jgi:hypothetical protein
VMAQTTSKIHLTNVSRCPDMDRGGPLKTLHQCVNVIVTYILSCPCLYLVDE